jgi:ElaB/YqjD/DUF883 family membrane-anchored ribosome-binding protein
MSTPIASGTIATAERNFSEAAADISRRAAAVGDIACQLGEAASEAVDDSMRAARRALKTASNRIQDAVDLRDEAVHRVRRAPLTSVSLAFGAGILVGVVTGMVTRQRAPIIQVVDKTHA